MHNARNARHDLPVFLDVDGPIVVVLHGRIFEGLVVGSIVGSVSHERIVVGGGLAWPCRGSIVAVVLGSLYYRRRNWRFCLDGRRLGLRCCGGHGRCRLGGWLFVVAEEVSQVMRWTAAWPGGTRGLALTGRRKYRPRSCRQPLCG